MALKRLSTKLNFLLGGILILAVVLIAAVMHFVILHAARAEIERGLRSAASIYTHIWDVQSRPLIIATERLSRDFTLRQAVTSGDMAMAESALVSVRETVSGDVSTLVSPDGTLMAGDMGAEAVSIAQFLSVDEKLETRSGIMMSQGKVFYVVAAPVIAPDLSGWVVLGTRLDLSELNSLLPRSDSPLTMRLVTQEADGRWLSNGQQLSGPATASLPANIDKSLSRATTQSHAAVTTNDVIAYAVQLRSMDPSRPVVLLSTYPVKEARDLYKGAQRLLLVVWIAIVLLIVMACLYMVRHVLKALRTMTTAASDMAEGRSAQLLVPADQELAEAARAFNTLSVSIEEREQRILQMSRIDSATGLPNRTAFAEDVATRRDLYGHHGMAVMAIGLQRFAHIRALWGIPAANALMVRLKELVEEIAPDAALARLSADTLGVLHCPCTAPESDELAERIVQRLSNRIQVEGQTLDVMVHLGVYHVPKARPGADEMIERVLIALDQARASKTRIAHFNPQIYTDMADTLLLTEQLHAALEDHALSVFYQPKYSYREERIASAEALVRWNHPERGMVSPQRFVHIAEETGYIRDLTLQVVETVISDQKYFQDQGFDLRVSVNYSGRLVSDQAFNAQVLAMLRPHKGQIVLEITETAVIEDPEIGLAAIEAFVANGIQISIDDFGTGLSSLAYLRQIPASELKIDRSFIKDIVGGQRDALLVRSTIDMAHGLGMYVTAEGVETAQAFNLLQSMGCDMAQGFGIARPMPVDQTLDFLRDFTAPKRRLSAPQRLLKQMK